MSDWPANPVLPLVTITPWSLDANGHHHQGLGTSMLNTASTVWPSANLALYFPFMLNVPVTVVKMFTGNGATASNNIDVGLYDISGNRLVSSGSTAQAGTNAIQEFNITDTQIGPGIFYMAITMNGVVGTLLAAAQPALPMSRGTGRLEQATAFALPATATFAAAATTAYVPLFGLTTRVVV